MRSGMCLKPTGFRARNLMATIALTLFAAGPATARVSPQAAARRTQERLHVVQAQIARVTRQVEQSRLEQSRLTQALRTTEQSAGTARTALAGIRRQRAALAARREQLAARRQASQADLTHTRRVLLGELRAAYLIGRQGALTLLLNQGRPGRVQRMFAYYSYFGRQRAHDMVQIEADLQHIQQLDGALRAADAQLAGLERQRQSQCSKYATFEHFTSANHQYILGL